jgi:uncharacterized protein (TIGR00255 family)
LANGVAEIERKHFDDDLIKELSIELLKSFEICCHKLQKDRQQEGDKIKTVLEQMLDKIASLVKSVSDKSKNTSQMLKEKLHQQLKELIEDSSITVSEDRLAQEIILLVNRADIREEIDRLNTHIKTAGELLNSNQAVGRRFDFLCQEFNREANTACSKAADVGIVNYGMELKAAIEQLREQVQNME